ncbi:MAG: helix-turn-helix transcriptional regulator, partial [SAR324 cluster bacterium]|nr:helix-turn-helix transcriptional regulator [SAR324 cluster bacterium]
MDQKIQYCTSPDGVRIAYSAIGKGPTIVRASHWLSYLEKEVKSPVWRHLVLGLAERHTLVRYDARGTGLSDRNVNLEDITFENWVGDLECVVDAQNLENFTL